MDAGLAITAVEYAIQLAQHIKHTVNSFHKNPAEYEGLLSKFRSIRNNLKYLKDSGIVDLNAPLWGSAFRRIRSEFQRAVVVLREIRDALRSQPVWRFIIAKDTGAKLKDLQSDIDILQRDLDMLGFFTTSNATNAQQSDNILHNVEDVQTALQHLEGRLSSLEVKLQETGHASSSGNPSATDRDPREQASPLEISKNENGELEKSKTEWASGGFQQRILQRISNLELNLKESAIRFVQDGLAEAQNPELYEELQSTWDRWHLDVADIKFYAIRGLDCSETSSMYQGSLTIRSAWHEKLREARVAIKVVRGVMGSASSMCAMMRRIVVLREIRHPCIVSFYGVCWPIRSENEYAEREGVLQSEKQVFIVTELMSHNLETALRSGSLWDMSQRIRVLRDIASGIEYLHIRGLFRISLCPEHVLLRIVNGHVIGHAKLTSFWSEKEQKLEQKTEPPQHYKDGQASYPVPTKGVPQRRTERRRSIRHFAEDSLHFGWLMCRLLSVRGDDSKGRTSPAQAPPDVQREPVVSRKAKAEDIPVTFLRDLTECCINDNPNSRPSLRFIRMCLEAFLKKEQLPNLTGKDCGMALNKQAELVFHGKHGSPPDPERAVTLFQKAVAKGNVAALVNLGNCHFYGLGTTQNSQLGFQLFKSAASAGLAAGQLKLGTCYHSGFKGKTDVSLAVELYRRAAVQGNVSALFKLGCYKFSEETSNEAHKLEAAGLWKQAATGGHRFAQFFLAKCYENGTGVERDLSAAQIWYTRAAAQGHFGAKWAVRRMANTNVAAVNI